MRHIILSLSLSALIPVSGAMAAPEALAQWPSCPAPQSFADEKAELLAELSQTRSRATGLFLTQKLVSLWTTAPNWHAQELLNSGIMRRQLGDTEGALEVLSTLVTYCPAFAEARHQRALIHRASGDFEAALADLDAALDLAPQHLGALARKAQVLSALDREAEAEMVRTEVLSLNPWMPDRLTRHAKPGRET